MQSLNLQFALIKRVQTNRNSFYLHIKYLTKLNYYLICFLHFLKTYVTYMKNIFSKISSIAKNISSFTKEKIDSVTGSTKAKVGAILTASFLWVSAQVEANQNWVQVDTPGMGPREFAVKNFGTEDWKKLRDKEWNYVLNPNTDFRLWKEYTIGRRENIVKNESKKTAPIVTKNEKKENPFVLNETYTLSYNDLQSKLNITAYKEAVATFESNGKYTARNDKKWKENGVEVDKWAFWKYQFTVGTLKWYWVYLTRNGVLDEKRVQAFLWNKDLQEELMNKYIDVSLGMISGSEEIHKPIIEGKVSIPALLAKWHIAWHGSIEKKWGGKDWLGTPVRVYAKKIEKTYHDMIAANDPSITVSEASISTSEQVTFASVDITDTPQVEKIAKAQVQSANDSFYSENISDFRKVSNTITQVAFDVESRVDAVISDISDMSIRSSIEGKLTPYETKVEWLYANLYHYDTLAAQYEKEARSAIRIKRESLLADAKEARETARKLRQVIAHFEWNYMQKAA